MTDSAPAHVPARLLRDGLPRDRETVVVDTARSAGRSVSLSCHVSVRADELCRDFRDDRIAVGAQSSHAGGSPMSQREGLYEPGVGTTKRQPEAVLTFFAKGCPCRLKRVRCVSQSPRFTEGRSQCAQGFGCPSVAVKFGE